MALYAPFRRKIGFKCNLGYDGMKRYLRRVAKRSNRQFQHSLNIPVNMVRKLKLSESIVELKMKEDYIIIKKVGETLESIAIEDEENKDYTIHY